MMTCFIGGFIGIQAISRLLHQLMPSHVVECDHSHDEHVIDTQSESHSRRHSRASHDRGRLTRQRSSNIDPTHHIHSPKIGAIPEVNGNGLATESTPLLPTAEVLNGRSKTDQQQRDVSARSDTHAPLSHAHHANTPITKIRSRSGLQPESRRPSMVEVRNRVMSFVKDTKRNCDGDGPCFGYTDPCGQECFKHLGSRSALTRQPAILRTTMGSLNLHSHSHPVFPEVHEYEEDGSVASPLSPTHRISRARSRETADREADASDDEEWCEQMSEGDPEAQHHHHVPTNAFLSIGLQTVIAIALHKFPEGFITYATNHANPSLGFNVFMALFVHNIAEGFAMALPLYMALGSRLKAMLWSSLLGGASQPLGAAIAVLFFKLSKRTNITIDNVAYACLFAITAGIMTSVALQLFVESLSLNHNRNLSIGFAFLGMLLLGLSNALVADDH